MRKNNRLFIFVLIISFLFGSTKSIQTAEPINAAQLPEESQAYNECPIQIISYDAENNRSLAVVRANMHGLITGDGVRLRATPSSSGAVLEKMYRGEHVWILQEGTSWTKIQRIETGTVGWASSAYITKI